MLMKRTLLSLIFLTLISISATAQTNRILDNNPQWTYVDGETFNAFSQNTEVNTTTVVYDIGEEGNKQNLSYSIENGFLRIKGYMFVNCCGVHLLN